MSNGFTRRDVLKIAGASAALAAGGRLLHAQTQPQERTTMPANTNPYKDAFKDGKYTLPPLPYPTNALEDVLDARTLEIHHDRHHAAYVKGFNDALDQLVQARQAGDFARVSALSDALAFNGSGHMLHCLFWYSMTPGGSAMPDSFVQAMNKSFGSVESATAQFASASKLVQASGWGVLAYEPVGDQLMILQAQKHQDLTIWGVTPIMVCDAWEHAYYLKYQNNRAGWVDNFMKIIDWQGTAARYEAARRARTTQMG